MARYTQDNQTTGVSMSGPVYEPQVSPYDRDDDDVSVLQNRGPYRDDFDDKAYGRNDYAASGEHRHGRRDDGDVWNRRDLTPTYEQPVEDGKARQAQPWDNYHRRHEKQTDAYRDTGQYRQPWDDYLGRRR